LTLKALSFIVVSGVKQYYRTQGGGYMHIIWTIIIGLLAGLVAKFVLPGKDPGGFIVTTLIGIAGALIATYLGQAIGWYQVGQSAGFIGAVVGSIILLLLYRLFFRKKQA
jgi:uncharacterized membrane protein YeaQ/YmgE (transglycosylase-associated protein family)